MSSHMGPEHGKFTQNRVLVTKSVTGVHLRGDGDRWPEGNEGGTVSGQNPHVQTTRSF